jgi:putative phosphoribosyl transferase
MSALVQESLTIAVEVGHDIGADLDLPVDATGLVVFAHGSGSSRFSSRNRAIAAALNARGLGTLLLDLLTEQEAQVDAETPSYRFDVPRLASRVTVATDWILRQSALATLPIGYQGTSSGAAAALIAAAERWTSVAAVVSRGGRPELATEALPRVKAPTLLIVGGNDPVNMRTNERAMFQMKAAHVEMAVVPGATHMFEEPGALDHVSQLAGDWFARYLHPR